jgi:hypothetical protein
MSNRYAVVNNGLVSNVVLSGSPLADNWVKLPDGSRVSAGWTYDGSEFAFGQLPDNDRKITLLAFLERFTDAEAIGIDLASQGATFEAATVRRFMNKVNAATFIDLARPDTINGVNAMVSYGFLTSERASEILTSPVQDIERPQQ